MLPSPVSYPRHRQKLASTSPDLPTSWPFWRNRFASLLARSRVTNLGLLVLLSCLVVSVLFNVRVVMVGEWDGVGRLEDNGWETGYMRSVKEAEQRDREATWRKLHVGGKNDAPALKENDDRAVNSQPLSLGVPASIDAIIRRPPILRNLYHLVLVPCHGVWVGNKPEDVYDLDKWVLEKFDREGGRKDTKEEDEARVRAFVEHVKKGVEIASEDPHSLLVLSGAPTRPPTPLSESTSYLSLALSLGLISTQDSDSLFLRTTTEEHALDSYQNLLFGLARFREVVGSESVGGGYPMRITVVGFGMKQRRFEELHARAVRWKIGETSWHSPRKDKDNARVVREGEEDLDDGPESDPRINAPRWTYIGIDLDIPSSTSTSNSNSNALLLDAVQHGELHNGYGPFLTDMYGCHTSLLRKRRARNPYRRVHGYHVSAPELAGLLEWCPEAEMIGGGGEGEDGAAPVREVYTKVYEGKLPWDGLWDD